jgi:hypothetical protein
VSTGRQTGKVLNDDATAEESVTASQIPDSKAGGETVPVTAIRRLLDYVEHDERRDYEADPRDTHIYRDIKAVAKWFDNFEAADADAEGGESEGATVG